MSRRQETRQFPAALLLTVLTFAGDRVASVIHGPRPPFGNPANPSDMCEIIYEHLRAEK